MTEVWRRLLGAKVAGAQGTPLASPQAGLRHSLGTRFVGTSPTYPSCFMLLLGTLLRLVGNAITGTVGGLCGFKANDEKAGSPLFEMCV